VDIQIIFLWTLIDFVFVWSIGLRINAEVLHVCSLVADSLRFTSALSVALAVVFLVIAVGISIVKIISGGITMPRLFPAVTDATSIVNLFTVVPVFVTAYICHYNGMHFIQTFYVKLIYLFRLSFDVFMWNWFIKTYW